jgi:glycosyltransferase involved in cell wall biosynthesis
MNILLSAFACNPEWGSEAGVGWAWAEYLTDLGHEVYLLTTEGRRASIQRALETRPRPNLHVSYMEVDWCPGHVPIFGIYPFYFAWQFKAFLQAKKLFKVGELDCVHHLTYGSYRTPFFLSCLGVPSILGPIGGGETVPLRLTKGMSFRGILHECIRKVANATYFLNPISHLVWHRSTLILAVTEETLRIVPRRYRHKCRVLLAVTTPASRPEFVEKVKERGQLRALFVGRFLGWKGAHLAIRALKIARKTAPGITLRLIGFGLDEVRLKALARSNGVEDAIEWTSEISRAELLAEYGKHDMLIFTNLRDAGATVGLEALSRGMPILCFKLGPYGSIIDSSCGSSIDADERSVDEIVQAMADELVRFCAMPEREWRALREGACERGQQFRVKETAGKAYTWLAELCNS